LTTRRVCLAIVALALFLRAWPIDHGLPRRYVPDHHVIKRALTMAATRDLAPPMTADMSYPYLVPYLLVPTYAAEYAIGRAGGEWANSEDFKREATLRPGLVHVPARAWMALFGALTAWAVFRAARAAGLGSGATFASFLTATCLLDLQISTHERPWAATIFFGALAAWAAVEHARSGSRRALLLSGVSVGLSFACHPSGLAFVVLPALAWAFAPRAWSSQDLRKRLVEGLACAALFAVVAFAAGHAYLVHGRPTGEQVIGGGEHENVVSIGGQSIRTDVELDAIGRLSWSLLGYDPVLVVLGILGIAAALRFRPLRPMLAGLAIVAVAALVHPSDHVRYLLPACLLLALPAGAFLERAWERRALRPLLVALLAVPLVQALRFDCVLRREDTRAEGERVLADLPQGSVVAIDHYGPQVDLSRAAIERVAKLRTPYAREQLRRDYFEAGLVPPSGPGIDAIHCEDLFGVDARTLEYGVKEDPSVRELGATPREVLASLGVTHLVLAERRPGSETRPLAGLVAGREPLAVIEPSGDADHGAREAFLPTEMDFPLTALWTVERPGPRLSVYALESGGDSR
jgi:hypothetical protein